MDTNDTVTTALYFEFFTPGLVLESAPYTVSREEIIAFASEWDPQPFHLDDEAAANSVFGRISACSAHIFALSNKLADGLTPGEAQVLAGLGFDKMRMLLPLYAGDTIILRDETLAARVSRSNPERGIVTTRSQLHNQHDEVIFSTETSFLMVRDPANTGADDIAGE